VGLFLDTVDTNMETVRNFEIVSDRVTVYGVCT